MNKENNMKFSDLSNNARMYAIEKEQEYTPDYNWWDGVYEDAKMIGEILGIEVDNIYFSGFYSQGDGACFEGTYKYRKEAVKEIKSHAPLDKELHLIAQRLQNEQKRNFYQLYTTIKHQGHYSHEFCTIINTERLDGKYIITDVEEEIADILRDFMRYIYRSLEKEYDYLHSFEVARENILMNDYEFNEEGEIV
jgi:hypothetical protein